MATNLLDIQHCTPFNPQNLALLHFWYLCACDFWLVNQCTCPPCFFWLDRGIFPTAWCLVVRLREQQGLPVSLLNDEQLGLQSVSGVSSHWPSQWFFGFKSLLAHEKLAVPKTTKIDPENDAFFKRSFLSMGIFGRPAVVFFFFWFYILRHEGWKRGMEVMAQVGVESERIGTNQFVHEVKRSRIYVSEA